MTKNREVDHCGRRAEASGVIRSLTSDGRCKVAAAVWLLAASPVKGMTGETRCWIDKGSLVASAAFGDIAGDFLIDLSAPVSQLHNTRAQLAGLETPIVRRDLVLAGRRIADVTLAVEDLDGRTRDFDTSINGVIGADVLGRFVVEIDPEPCRLRLSTRKARAFHGGVRLPVQEAGGRPVIEATISDGARAWTGLFAIDTARWSSGLARARLSRPLSGDLGLASPPIRLRALEVGGHLFEQVPAFIDPAGAEGSGGSIGMAVWSSWRLRLDMRNGQLDLKAK